MPSTSRATTGIACVATLVGAALIAVPFADAATLAVNPRGTVAVTYRGNGHGHGMSQYGARGAALRGLGFARILGSYYRGTALTRTRRQIIRVRLSGFGTTVTVVPHPGLRLTGSDLLLGGRGVAEYRLVAGPYRGLLLQRLALGRGARWTNMRVGVPDGTGFWSKTGTSIRVMRPGGASVSYWGQVTANRVSGTGYAGGVYVVDRVGVDRYVAGVTPREMPASWPGSALEAQAVAARTYAVYAAEHPQNARYDICDTTACQVYGGRYGYGPGGRVWWRDDPVAAFDTRGLVLTYRGSTIFAQFSASDGGWSVDGGQPYLAAHPDPFDGPASGDPYLGARETVSTASIARWFGLSSVTGITVTRRDGNGLWGGRVVAGYLTGRGPAGRLRQIPFGGSSLQWALGLGTTWFALGRP